MNVQAVFRRKLNKVHFNFNFFKIIFLHSYNPQEANHGGCNGAILKPTNKVFKHQIIGNIGRKTSNINTSLCIMQV